MTHARPITDATPVRYVITGPRTWNDRAPIADHMARIFAANPEAIIVHGDAPGADRQAADAARAIGLRVETVPAAWQVCACGRDCIATGTAPTGAHGPYCRAAGPARSAAMLALPGVAALLVCVCPTCALTGRGRCCAGTRATVDLARRAGLPTWGIRPSLRHCQDAAAEIHPAHTRTVRFSHALPAPRPTTPADEDANADDVTDDQRAHWDDELRPAPDHRHTVPVPVHSTLYLTTGETVHTHETIHSIRPRSGPIFSDQLREPEIDDPAAYAARPLIGPDGVAYVRATPRGTALIWRPEWQPRTVMADPMDRPVSTTASAHRGRDAGQPLRTGAAIRIDARHEAELWDQAEREMQESCAAAFADDPHALDFLRSLLSTAAELELSAA